jgi:hypothetical protein
MIHCIIFAFLVASVITSRVWLASNAYEMGHPRVASIGAEDIAQRPARIANRLTGSPIKDFDKKGGYSAEPQTIKDLSQRRMARERNERQSQLLKPIIAICVGC